MQGSDRISKSIVLRQDFWLLAIGAGLITIHLTLVSRTNDGSLFASSMLYWMATASLIGSKRNTLYFCSDRLPNPIGMFIIILILLKSFFISGYDPFLRISPLLSALGLFLVASGVSGLRQYWQILLALSFLAPPPTVLAELFNISTVTASFSAMLLWYSGFDAVRQGIYIVMPEGGIEVIAGCSGVENILHLLGLAVLFLLLFETRRIDKIIVPLVAVAIAFVINGIRVSVMAVLSSPTSKDAFEYWHKGDGSLLFSLITVALFALFCFVLLKHFEEEDHEQREESLENTDSANL